MSTNNSIPQQVKICFLFVCIFNVLIWGCSALKWYLICDNCMCIRPSAPPSMWESSHLNGQFLTFVVLPCNDHNIIILTPLTLNRGLTGQHSIFWILAHLVCDVTILMVPLSLLRNNQLQLMRCRLKGNTWAFQMNDMTLDSQNLPRFPKNDKVTKLFVMSLL